MELGGPNYKAQSLKLVDEDGREVPGGQRGYRYFGRAKDLPGVRELFQTEGAVRWDLDSVLSSSNTDPDTHRTAPQPKEKTRAELGKYVDADYYGYRDEDDGLLLAYEKKIEEAAHGKGKTTTGMEPPSVTKAKKRKVGTDKEVALTATTSLEEQDEDDESHQLYHAFISHVPNVPTQEEMADILLQKRKEALMKKYLGPEASMEKQITGTAR